MFEVLPWSVSHGHSARQWDQLSLLIMMFCVRHQRSKLSACMCIYWNTQNHGFRAGWFQFSSYPSEHSRSLAAGTHTQQYTTLCQHLYELTHIHTGCKVHLLWVTQQIGNRFSNTRSVAGKSSKLRKTSWTYFQAIKLLALRERCWSAWS